MLTTIILCIAVATIFYYLGFYSVLLTALSFVIKISMALILALASVLTWRWWKGRKSDCQWRKL
jgi:membrane protein DedA with SNARE-associated domain